jgi:copper(I)-binding protein
MRIVFQRSTTLERRPMMKRIPTYLIAGMALAVLLGGVARADDGITIDQAWARATPGNAKTGAIYITVTNHASTPDQLTAASTPVAATATLHETTMDNGVMKMRPSGPVTIAPGKTFVFKPDAHHIMLEGLKAPLKEGDKVPLTLTFAHAGTRQVTVSVAKAGAMGEDDMSNMPGMNSSGSSMAPSQPPMPSMPGMSH